jgi:hypothetical protein
MQVQNTPHFAAVQTEGALDPVMSHQEQVSILKSEMLTEVGVSLFTYFKFYTQWVPFGYHNKNEKKGKIIRHVLQCAMLLGQGIPKILAKSLLLWDCPSPWALPFT